MASASDPTQALGARHPTVAKAWPPIDADFKDGEHSGDNPGEAHTQRIMAEVRGYRLRELREEAGFTQAQLAERIGVGQRQVSKIEYVIGDQRIRVA